MITLLLRYILMHSNSILYASQEYKAVLQLLHHGAPTLSGTAFHGDVAALQMKNKCSWLVE